jgi:DNA-binding helix-hairpin-helix protein with protein kinase domain
MRAFEVFLNGERLCVAGIDGDGVLNAMVDHVKIKARDDLRLRVGGLVSATEEHLTWSQVGLTAGDEVRIRILESASVDEPERQKLRGARETEDELEEKKRFVRALAKKWGWTLTEPPGPSRPAAT